MIELRTGLPGNGKTLSVIQELAITQLKWDKGGMDSRPVFVHNVRDLLLPHSVFPVLEVKNEKTGAIKKIPDWASVPDGSLCILDEVQDLFPPRSSQSEAPAHVAWLNTHRHHGVDLVVITQHPKLIDGSLRALVGKHKHYRRAFGGNRSVVYEWDGCSDNLAGMKNAVTSYWPFPADAYKYYKSAELHTKQKFKLPYWLAIPVIGFIGCLFLIPRAYYAVKGTHDRPERIIDVQAHPVSASTGGAVAGAASASMASVKTTTETVTAMPLQTSAPSAEVIYKGCMVYRDRCACLRSDGALIEDLPQCRYSATHFGGLVKVALNDAVVAPPMAVSTISQPSSVNAERGAVAPAVAKVPREGLSEVPLVQRHKK